MATINDTVQTDAKGNADAFLTELRSRLLSSEAISSKDTAIEQNINKAIRGVQDANKANTERIEIQANREAGYIRDGFNDAQLTGRAAGAGGLMNNAALKALYLDTDKQMKDLDMRKEELILQGNATAASKIADLQIQSLEFRERAKQQTFTNLLGLANFGIQAQQEQRMARAQSFTERNAIAQIALEYGVEAREGDTIDTIVARAQPNASKKQLLELAKTQAEIRRINAETSKALRDANPVIDDAVIDSLARTSLVLETQGRTAEYENIIANITKGGQGSIDKFYSAKQKYLDEKILAEREALLEATKAKKEKKVTTKDLISNAAMGINPGIGILTNFLLNK